VNSILEESKGEFISLIKNNTYKVTKPMNSLLMKEEAMKLMKNNTPLINENQRFFFILDSHSSSNKGSTPEFINANQNAFNFSKFLSCPLVPGINYVDPKRYIFELSSNPDFGIFKTEFKD
jgi:hypothetical protein